MACPKCKAGNMSRMGINSSKWQCNVCGYVEYRGTSSSVNSQISANRQSRYEAADDFNAARRNANDALRELDNIGRGTYSSSSQKQGKGGISFWGIAVVAFIVWLLLNG